MASAEDEQLKRLKPKNIFEAVEQNNPRAVKKFVEEEKVAVTGVNEVLQNPAHIAAVKGNLKILKYLVEKDPAVLKEGDSYGHNVLMSAINNDHLDIVKYLVENYVADIHQLYGHYALGSTIIHRAAELGRLTILKYLVEERRADVHVMNSLQQPPLFLAAENQHFHIIRYLVEERHASLTMVDENQHTILHIAVNNDDLTLMKYVLDERKADLDINMKCKFGFTLVHRAAHLNRMEMLIYLVSKKHADVNSVNVWGESPLHSAARDNYYEVCKYLIEQGADIQAENNYGNLPIHDTTDARIQKCIDDAKSSRNRRSLIQLPNSYSSTLPSSQMLKNISPSSYFKRETFTYFDRVQSFLTVAELMTAIFRKSVYLHKLSFLPPKEMLKNKIDPIAIDSIHNFPHKFRKS